MEESQDEISPPPPNPTDNPGVSGVGTKRKAEWFDIEEEQNTYVYVSGLPADVTEDDFVDLMKKYGIIAKKSTLPGHPFNIKLYRNKDGTIKGDALCCYVRVESVELALTHLDGYQYDDNHVIKCERAKFQLKGSYDPAKKPKPLNKKSKLKQKKTIEKLLSWEPKKDNTEQKKVILKNMFTPESILEDATLILDLKEDVEAKCAEINCEPKRVDIYDKHPEGVIAVTFAERSHAELCIQAMDNQFYAGNTVKAELWDGKTNYKVKETDAESDRRLEKWHQDIQKSDEEDEVNTEIEPSKDQRKADEFKSD